MDARVKRGLEVDQDIVSEKFPNNLLMSQMQSRAMEVCLIRGEVQVGVQQYFRPTE